MRTAWALGLLVFLLPGAARAEDSVKIGKLEELRAVVAGVGGSALMAGGILMGIGADRRLGPGESADEIPIGATILITGAVMLGVGIPLAFIGKGKRLDLEKKEQEKKPAAMLVPTLGGAAAVIAF